MLLQDFCAEVHSYVQPVYNIKGNDDYWAYKAYSELVGLSADIDLAVFDGSEHVTDALYALDNFPMMGEYRVVVLRDIANFAQADKDALTAYCDNPSPTSVLVFFRCGWAPKGALTCTFDHVPAPQLVPFLTTFLQSRGGSASEEALRLLVDYCEEDMTRIEGELVKLQSYCGANSIDVDSVRAVVPPSENYRIYAFSEQVSAGNYVGAHKVLDSLVGSSSDCGAFLGLLINHYRRVLYSKICSESPKELGALLGNQKAFTMTKAAETARHYTPKALLGLLQCLYQLEFSFKTSQTTPEQALDVAVAEAIERRIH